MSRIDPPLGPYSAVYVGDWDSEEPLTLIDCESTGQMTPRVQRPMRYLPGVGYRTAGFQHAEFNLTFYDVHKDIIKKLCYGASLDSTNSDRADKTGGKTEYTVLAIHSNELIKASVYIPRMSTVKDYALPAGKLIAEHTVQFLYDNRNSTITPIYYDTAAACGAMMTNSRNPFA